jgi:hypothetical protein
MAVLGLNTGPKLAGEETPQKAKEEAQKPGGIDGRVNIPFDGVVCGRAGARLH